MVQITKVRSENVCKVASYTVENFSVYSRRVKFASGTGPKFHVVSTADVTRLVVFLPGIDLSCQCFAFFDGAYR